MSSLSQTPTQVGSSLNDLWKFLEENIPNEKHKQTPIFMFATAGLRVLGESVNEKIYDDDDIDDNVILEPDDDDFSKGPVAKIVNHLREYVDTKTSFQLIQNDHIRVLKGEEEGLFDFLTVQQLLKINPYARIGGDKDELWSERIFDPVITKNLNLYPIFTIDLGGASTQLAFETKNPRLFTHNITQFTLAPYKAFYPKIFTHSFLDYGINRAREFVFNRFVSLISKSVSVINNPCLYKDRLSKFLIDGNEIVMKGTGNFVQCRSGIRDFFLSKPGGNSIVDTEIPSISDDVTVITFDHSYRVSSLLGVHGFSSLDLLMNSSKDLLGLSWDEAVKSYPSLSEEELEKLPFEGMYVSHLIHEGYGFSKTTTRIGFADSIDGQSLSWALGALVYNVCDLCEHSKL